jgi:hypothetical protein
LLRTKSKPARPGKGLAKSVDAAAAELGYQGLNLIISGGMANKQANLDVGTALFCNLSAKALSTAHLAPS